ncbi:MAG: tetratricopeptide repeat protein [Bryobacteraceae bacterium]
MCREPHVTISRVACEEARQEYSRAQVRRLLKVTERQLRSWERQGLVRPLERYTIADLVVVRTLSRLRRDGVPMTRIRKALSALRRRLGELSDPLRDYRILAQGKRVVVQVGERKMEADSGQLLLDFGQEELRKLLRFPSLGKTPAGSESQGRRAESQAWFEQAVEMERRGTPVVEVIRTYEKAVEADPSSAAALVNLGTIYFHMHMLETAERYYRRAVEAEPDYPLAHFNLANLYDEKGDRGQALFHYLSAVRLDPSFPDAHYNLALLYQSSGQLMRAMRHWKTYLKLDPSSHWAASARQELEKLKQATLIAGAGSVKPNAKA